MNVASVCVPAAHRPGSSPENRYVRAASVFEEGQGVPGSSRQRHVPGGSSEPDDLKPRIGQEHQDCDGVIDSRIRVNDDRDPTTLR